MSSTNSLEEMVAIVDSRDNVVGQAPRASIHDGTLHRETAVLIITPHNEVVLQQRADNGKLSFSAAGHMGVEEDYLLGIVRETHEELGLSFPKEVFQVVLKQRLVTSKGKNDRFLMLWEVRAEVFPSQIKSDPTEVRAVKFLPLNVVRELVTSAPWEFTSAFATLFMLYLAKRNHELP